MRGSPMLAIDHRHAHDDHPHEGVHDHGHGPHTHLAHADATHGVERDDSHRHGEHGHTHGFVDRSILRSRRGVKTVAISLGVLAVTAVVQTAIFALSGSVALLADLIHNFGDALTAVPLGIAFWMRSKRAESAAGLVVVATIFISACVVAIEAVLRLIHQTPPTHLWAMAAAGAVGYLGKHVAAQIRVRVARGLDSPALIADAHHARADAYVSLAVIASAAVVAIGLP